MPSMEPTLSLNQPRRFKSKPRTRSLLMAFSNLFLNWALLPPLIPSRLACHSWNFLICFVRPADGQFEESLGVLPRIAALENGTTGDQDISARAHYPWHRVLV